MADTILVVVEQRQGQLNRVSWETLVAAQGIAAETGWPVQAAVVGNEVANIAGEIAAKKLNKVFALQSPRLEPYTPDAFVHALKAALIAKAKFTILHVAGNQGVAQEMDWTDFPGVRTTLGRGCSRAKVLEGEC